MHRYVGPVATSNVDMVHPGKWMSSCSDTRSELEEARARKQNGAATMVVGGGIKTVVGGCGSWLAGFVSHVTLVRW